MPIFNPFLILLSSCGLAFVMLRMQTDYATTKSGKIPGEGSNRKGAKLRSGQTVKSRPGFVSTCRQVLLNLVLSAFLSTLRQQAAL